MEEGEGVSWVTYTLNTAGPVTLEAILPEAAGCAQLQGSLRSKCDVPCA